jgi:hypothetical protein
MGLKESDETKKRYKKAQPAFMTDCAYNFSASIYYGAGGKGCSASTLAVRAAKSVISVAT